MIGFPGIGLEFQRSPEIFRFTDRYALYWYGLIIVAGVFLAIFYCLRQAKQFGLKQDELVDMLLFAIPAGIVGSRLYFVAFNWEEFRGEPLSILYTWQGGMTIHGAILGAAAAAGLFCWVRHINAGAMFDVGAMGLLIGQAVGRWGNFVNGEVYGKPTDLPWRMAVRGQEVHPLFLYESLWNILGLVLLRLLMKKRKYNGQMFTLYIAWYGLGRGLMEGMRAPAFNLMAGSWMVSQAVAAVSCVAALALLFYMTLFRKHPPLLAWTAERDEYEVYRKERRQGAAATEEALPGEGNETEGGADEGEETGNGDTDGRDSDGEDDSG
ncbi:MAG: prolipoprotein diacylglyceryl transferase [Oscillospiraceae bacterium]|nr:prolipoprotein diacylglyceryl transferase [Oscillospiraceae bacterium]